MSGWSSKAEALDVLKLTIGMIQERDTGLPATPKAYYLGRVFNDYIFNAGMYGWRVVEHDEGTFHEILRRHRRAGWEVPA